MHKCWSVFSINQTHHFLLLLFFSLLNISIQIEHKQQRKNIVLYSIKVIFIHLFMLLALCFFYIYQRTQHWTRCTEYSLDNFFLFFWIFNFYFMLMFVVVAVVAAVSSSFSLCLWFVIFSFYFGFFSFYFEGKRKLNSNNLQAIDCV